jgi:hypothetical protein
MYVFTFEAGAGANLGRHHRLSGRSPGKPNSGTGVARSLPQDFENSRKPAVMTVHTVWLPMSSRLVSQQPSRKNPVIGLKEQTSSRPPSTFLGSLRRSPPLPASSLNIGILCTFAPSLTVKIFQSARSPNDPNQSAHPKDSSLARETPGSLRGIDRWRETRFKTAKDLVCPPT